VDYETEIREAIFKLRNDTNQSLKKRDIDDQTVLALMLSTVLNATEEGLVILSRQIESLRRLNSEDQEPG
jgi:hypothetical protein